MNKPTKKSKRLPSNVINVKIKELPKEWDLPKWAKKFNFVSGAITLIVGIAIIILTYSTLDEIKTQRVKSSQPELRLFPQPFHMVCRIDYLWPDIQVPRFNILTYNKVLDSSKMSYAIDIKTMKKLPEWHSQLDIGNDFNMPIYNIGQGTGIDVKVQFEIDTTYFVNFFNKYKKILNNPDSVFIKDNHFYFINKNDTSYLLQFKDPQEFQFIPILSQASDTIRITLPLNYFQLISLRHFIICIYTSDFENKLKLEYPELDKFNILFEIPPCYVTLTYSDINDGKYTRKFECKPVISGYGISYNCNPVLHGFEMSVKLIDSEDTY